MKVGCVADVHLGNFRKFGGALVAGLNDRCRAVLKALESSVEAATRADCNVYLVAGDLFDSSTPPPQLIAATQDILAKAKESMEVVILRGNHDMDSDTEGDDALGPLREWATIVEKPTVLSRGGGSIVCLPYDSRPAAEWFEATLDELMSSAPGSLLAMHLGMMDDNTPPWLRDARDAVSTQLVLAKMKQHEIPWGVAGNWHNHGAWGDDPEKPNLVQCGALVPTGWDNEGIDGYGGLIVFEARPPENGGSVSALTIPGPRFVRARTLTDLKKAEKKAKDRKLQVYVQLVSQPDEVADMTAELEAARARGGVVDGGVEVDAKLISAAAQTAARSAQKAETLEEALTGFVGSMPLDEDLDRKKVLELCSGWLGGGR